MAAPETEEQIVSPTRRQEFARWLVRNGHLSEYPGQTPQEVVQQTWEQVIGSVTELSPDLGALLQGTTVARMIPGDDINALVVIPKTREHATRLLINESNLADALSRVLNQNVTVVAQLPPED
jgi:hypothetical protein